MTLAELREKHPDLVAQIEAAARQGLIAQADADTARTEAVSAEGARILALVSAAVGEETGKKIGAAAAKGLTADDLQALGVSLAPAAAGDDASRQRILEGLEDAAPAALKAAKPEEARETERKTAVSAIAAGGSIK